MASVIWERKLNLLILIDEVLGAALTRSSVPADQRPGGFITGLSLVSWAKPLVGYYLNLCFPHFLVCLCYLAVL